MYRVEEEQEEREGIMEESMQDELQRLKQEVAMLKRGSVPNKVSRLHLSPSSIAEVSESAYLTPVTIKRKPKVAIDHFNNCAKAMIDHQTERTKWRKNNHVDDKAVSALLLDINHYVGYANTSQAKYANGMPVQCLIKMRRAFGLKQEITPAQGKELQHFALRLMRKRGVTKAEDSVKLDPIRTDFKEFIGKVCLDHFVNPLVPRETGKSSQDYGKRIDIIAKQIRKIFFGEPHETTFFYEGDDPDGPPMQIILPTLQQLVKDIKAKLYEKENQESKYIKKWLNEYEAYVSAENFIRTKEEDDMHQRSRPVIEQYKREKLSHGVVLNEGLIKRKGGRGKARLFSNFAFVADESTLMDHDWSLTNEDKDSYDDMSPVEKLVASHSALTSKQQRAKVVKSKEEEKEEAETAAVIGTEAAPGVFIAAYAQPKVLSRVAFAGISSSETSNSVSFKKANMTKKYQSAFMDAGEERSTSEWNFVEEGMSEFDVVSRK